jgi:HAMP domain-containing protein
MAAVIVAGLLGAALVVAASWALSRGLARPIIALDVATRRLRRGESVTVEVTTRDEIGRLAQSFNLMASEIREREADDPPGLARRRDRPAQPFARSRPLSRAPGRRRSQRTAW